MKDKPRCILYLGRYNRYLHCCSVVFANDIAIRCDLGPNLNRTQITLHRITEQQLIRAAVPCMLQICPLWLTLMIEVKLQLQNVGSIPASFVIK